MNARYRIFFTALSVPFSLPFFFFCSSCSPRIHIAQIPRGPISQKHINRTIIIFMHLYLFIRTRINTQLCSLTPCCRAFISNRFFACIHNLYTRVSSRLDARNGILQINSSPTEHGNHKQAFYRNQSRNIDRSITPYIQL